MAQHKRNLQLAFDYVICERCNEQRILARSCINCGRGPEPDERQQDLSRRIDLVDEFQANRITPTSLPVADLSQLERQVDETTRAVERALAKASRGNGGPEVLVTAFSQLDSVALSWQLPQLRPNRNLGKLIGRALGQLRAGYEKFLDAMCAPDMNEAQRCEAEGNAEIRLGEYHLEQIEELIWAGEVSEGSDPLQVANSAGRAIRDRLGNPATIEALELELRRIEGTGSVSGSGVEHQMMRILALTQFDFDRFSAIRDSVADALGRSVAFLGLGREEAWRRQHAMAQSNLSGSLSAANLVVNSGDSGELDIVNSAVRCVATLRDGVLRHAVATLVACDPREYDSFVNRSGGFALKAADRRFPEIPISEGLEPSFRHAGGHGGVDDLDGDQVTIQGKTFSPEQFIDVYLAYLETVLSVWSGLNLALDRLGGEFKVRSYISPRDVKTAITAGVGILGVECASIEMRRDKLWLKVNSPDHDWLQVAAFVSGIELVDANSLLIDILGDVEPHHFTASLSAFREADYAAAAMCDEENALLVAGVLAACALDGVSLWYRQDWSAVLSKLTSLDGVEDYRVWIARLKDFRRLATEVGDDDSAASCVSAIRSFRAV
ncbi:hypothetical protein ACXET9_15945 [Brachybacterium sp. DNPG3]